MKSGNALLISPFHCRELANPELKVYACPIGITFFDELCLQSQWDFDIIGLVASRSVSVRCKWEIPDYKEDKSHNSAAKLWHVRNANLEKLSI